jgi:hypothetical protein
VLIGLLGSAWSWWSRRRRWVLPAAFVVIGALVLAVAVADFQTVRPEEVRMEEVDERPVPEEATAFSAPMDLRFDGALSVGTARLLRLTGAQLVAERREGDTLVRVYELNPQRTRDFLAASGGGQAADRTMIARSARVIGGIGELRRGAVAAPMIHLEFLGDGTLTVEAGYS